MDAEGEVLAKPTDRSVASFQACLDALNDLPEIEKRVAAGDAAAATELLLAENALGRVDEAEFKTRAAALTAVTAEQKVLIEQIQVDNEIWRLITQERDSAKQAAGLLALLDAGKRPSKAPRYAQNFWSTLARWAQSQGDAALLRRCVTGMREDLGDNENMVRYADSLEDTAAGLDRRDALVARAEAGEQGLEAQILLLEAELKAVTLAAYNQRLEAALAVASPEQKETLLQTAVDLEVEDLWRGGMMREEGYENAGARMIELLTADGRRPSEQWQRQALSLAARWADTHKEDYSAEVLAELAAQVDKHYGSFPYWAELADRLEAAAEAGTKPAEGN